jgi:Ca2+-binding RTX toxin-like protein
MDVDQSTGSANTLYYTTDGDQNSGNDDVKIRMATSLNGGVNWTTANLTTTTSNETGGYFGDYLEYIGLDVYDGTAHGLFSFRHDATDDLDALTVDAAFVNSNNTLTINGDDTGTTNDTIVVQRSAVNSAYLEVFVNGHRQFTGRYDTVGKIVVNGLNGNDTITIGSTVTIPTTIDGGAGNDSITGGGGSDTLVGGSGNDVYIYAGASNLGSDQIVEAANADTDTIDFTNFNTGGYPVSLNLSQTTSQTVGLSSLHVALANIQLSSDTGIENLQGSNYAGSIFTGNSRNNALIAGSSANFSVLQGNDGNDTLTGGPVNDTLIGGNGNDSVTGNAGNDWIFFDAGDDALNGGTGNDMYLIQGATNLGTDQVIEPDNADSDTLDFSNFTTSGYQVQIDLSQTTSQTVGLSFLNSGLVNIQLSSATGIENVTGTNNAGNLLTGNSRNNVLSAGSGNNFSLLQGGDGNDTLNGGAGSDTLIGGNGNDSTAGNAGSDLTIDGAGDDTMSGGTGNDTYILGSGTNSLIEAANADTDTLDLSGLSQAASLNIGQTGNQTVAAGVLTLNLSSDTGIENVNGSSFADSITGNARDNSILGNAGDDTLYGVDGNDTIRGGDGNDVIDGGLGTDSIFGDNGNDSITALDSAADTIDGGAGTDTVTSHDSLDSITNVEVIN